MPKGFKSVVVSDETYEKIGEIVNNIKESTGFRVTKAGVIENLVREEMKRIKLRQKRKKE